MEVERCTHVSVNATRRALLCVAEQYLYCYPRIKQELARVELDIILRGSSTIDAPVGRTSVVSDPTAQRGVLLADSASVQRNRAVVRVIEDVFDSLPGNLKRLTRLIFWRHQSLGGAARALGISRETARQWRADVVWRVAMSLGGGATGLSDGTSLLQQDERSAPTREYAGRSTECDTSNPGSPTPPGLSSSPTDLPA